MLSKIVGIWLLLISVCFGASANSPSANSIVALTQQNTQGQYTSMVLDGQGNPVISFYNATDEKLEIAHCVDNDCTRVNKVLTPDTTTDVGKYSSLALDADGNPVISYYDEANTTLRILHCGNTSCSTNNKISIPDKDGNVGKYTSLTIDSHGWPVVSYYDASKGILKILHCGNAACTHDNSIATPDLSSSNGVESSIQLNSNGNPVVAYFDFSDSSLKILVCGNPDCSAGNKINTVESIGEVGRYPSLALDKNGFPAVSYLDLTNGKLKVLRCGNATCSRGNTIVPVGSGAVVGYYSSLKIGANNIPVVSYYDKTNGDLNILECGNSSCSSNNVILAPDTRGDVGLYTSMMLDLHGYPIISYYDASNGKLKVLHCHNYHCSTGTSS